MPIHALAPRPPAVRGPLLCFSHLRWNFVFQRPQHLMTRFARHMPVFFFEEPQHTDARRPTLETTRTPSGVVVVTPRLPSGVTETEAVALQRELLNGLRAERDLRDPLLWYYTPEALAFSGHIQGRVVVYDCMDELSAFKGAPTTLAAHERELMGRADLVFTGGYSLYEAKRNLHPRVHAFPSSVDVQHFAQARERQPEPADQAVIPHPRLGYYGAIDERLDLDLLAAVADSRPAWHLVMIGPIVKVDPAALPRRPNIHYLGMKDYAALPAYVSGWDVALMPFALNEATRFISPTKTPEYLAAGCPVVSTPITDVVRHYGGDRAVIGVAGTPDTFVAAIEQALCAEGGRQSWLAEVDRLLFQTSWDATWTRMAALIDEAAAARVRAAPPAVSGMPLRRRGFDVLVVGAGFAGSVLAERLAAGLGKRVLLIDRRPHIGGNAYDCYDDAGILIHRYGPHVFHTNSRQVFEYLSRFTQWRPYEHRVRAHVDGQLVPIPINLTTINQLYGLDLSSEQVESFLAARAEPVADIRTSEDVVVGRVGRELYEKFFRGYTRKQWGLDPSELDKSVTSRVPTRTDTDDRYFTDTYQCMPLHGYTRMFERMLDHPNIKIMLNTDFRDIAREVEYRKLIYTGPIDEFFGFRYGKLPYRSLQFRHETLNREYLQPVAVVNHPSQDTPYTRVTEYKHLTGQQHQRTSISYEFPWAEGDPYYPVPRPENARLFKRYQTLADQMADVLFVGRLATYRYYNMDQVVGQALALYARLAASARTEGDNRAAD